MGKMQDMCKVTIENNAFRGCDSLPTITFPESVKFEKFELLF